MEEPLKKNKRVRGQKVNGAQCGDWEGLRSLHLRRETCKWGVRYGNIWTQYSKQGNKSRALNKPSEFGLFQGLKGLLWLEY